MLCLKPLYTPNGINCAEPTNPSRTETYPGNSGTQFWRENNTNTATTKHTLGVLCRCHHLSTAPCGADVRKFLARVCRKPSRAACPRSSVQGITESNDNSSAIHRLRSSRKHESGLSIPETKVMTDLPGNYCWVWAEIEQHCIKRGS